MMTPGQPPFSRNLGGLGIYNALVYACIACWLNHKQKVDFLLWPRKTNGCIC